ncbi:MAG TPA: hypothetical protein VG603_10200 [Chitinophagales bacterium]|nr:hypothetical protein [Chitinophagales bacterium]
MKKSIVIPALLFFASASWAGNPYRWYLLSTVYALPQHNIQKQQAVEPVVIPKYAIPKGAVFCRMEDKLTRATKIWIKVGVK